MKKKQTKKASKQNKTKKASKKVKEVKNKETDLLVEIIHDILDKNTSDTVRILIGKKNVNEFIIAKKLNLTINQIRNILYKLSDLGLVSFTRKKDKRKGWYTYFWTLNLEKSFGLLDKILNKKIEDLEFQLKGRETKRYYLCKICKTEVSEETALINNFTCRECGEIYELANNESAIKEIKSKIARIQRDYYIVKEQIDIIKEKENKKVSREKKKQEKKKSRKRKPKETKKKEKKPKKKIKSKKKTIKKKKK